MIYSLIKFCVLILLLLYTHSFGIKSFLKNKTLSAKFKFLNHLFKFYYSIKNKKIFFCWKSCTDRQNILIITLKLLISYDYICSYNIWLFNGFSINILKDIRETFSKILFYILLPFEIKLLKRT